MHRALCIASLGGLILGCSETPLDEPTSPPPTSPPSVPAGSLIFQDVSDTSLPEATRLSSCMDAHAADIDGDGDIDVILAVEFGQNHLLLNRGDGTFDDGTSGLPVAAHDSEDIATSDFDGDGMLDIVFVSEDDEENEFYVGAGDGTFTAAPMPLPTQGVSNAVAAFELDDGFVHLLIGNQGPEAFLMNDGTGSFVDASGSTTVPSYPISESVTQDVELGDVDGDGDLDVYVANEGLDELWIRQDDGSFVDEAEARLPMLLAETREADFGDADGDGDLDIVLANVSLFSEHPNENHLLLNDGTGAFTLASAGQLPPDAASSFDADWIDIDADGDLDIVLGDASFDGGVGGVRIWRNAGNATFVDATSSLLVPLTDHVFDIEAADFDGDGRIDLYICSRGVSGEGMSDHLLRAVVQ